MMILSFLATTFVLAAAIPVESPLSSDDKVEIYDITKEAAFKEKVLENQKTVLLEFGATWCKPCRTMKPRVEEVVKELKGRIVLVRAETDYLGEHVLKHYDVKTLPVLYIVKNGKAVSKLSSVKSKQEIQQFILKEIDPQN